MHIGMKSRISPPAEHLYQISKESFIIVKKAPIIILAVSILASCMSSMYTLQSSFQRVSDKVIPSVVQVNVITITTQQVPKGGGPWDFFFPNPEEGEQGLQEKEFKMEGLGSGVIVDKKADTYFVLTNNHVIGDGKEITITLHDKRMYPAQLIGRDPRRDVALVSFNAVDTDISVAAVGDSDSLKVGDWALAVGNPFGLDSTVTAGIISGLHRSGPTDIADFIQTDASINQGNSGGALINLKGEVIGINTWIQTPTGGNIGLGFAIPINSAVKAVKDFIQFGEVRYGWLGVTLTDPGAGIRDEYGYSVQGGAFVTNVFKASPGYIYGLRPGDLITRINGKTVKNVDHMIYLLGELAIDDAVNIEYYRQSAVGTAEVFLELRKTDKEIREMYDDVWPGLSVYPLDSEILKQLDLDTETKGVYVVNVEDRTAADNAGFMSGDVVQELNGKVIAGVGSFYAGINAPADSYVFSVLREGEKKEITISENGSAE